MYQRTFADFQAFRKLSQKFAMVLPPSRLARGGPAVTAAAMPPLPFSPWQAEHFA